MRRQRRQMLLFSDGWNFITFDFEDYMEEKNRCPLALYRKLASQIKAHGGITYESRPKLHGVVVHGIRLRPYDLGLVDLKQERLLCNMRSGIFSEHHHLALFAHPIHVVPDTRDAGEVKELFPNLQGRSWPLLSTHAGIVDVNFLVSVVATQKQREDVLALPHDTRDFPCVRDVVAYNNERHWKALEINFALFTGLMLCAATRSAQEVWYDTDPNFELVSLEHEGVRLRMRENTDPEQDIVYANQDASESEEENEEDDPLFGWNVHIYYPRLSPQLVHYVITKHPLVTCAFLLASFGLLISGYRRFQAFKK